MYEDELLEETMEEEGPLFMHRSNSVAMKKCKAKVAEAFKQKMIQIPFSSLLDQEQHDYQEQALKTCLPVASPAQFNPLAVQVLSAFLNGVVLPLGSIHGDDSRPQALAMQIGEVRTAPGEDCGSVVGL
jgi:hypothetical protein